MMNRTPSKRPFMEILDEDCYGPKKEFRFQILLPNGTSTHLIFQDPGEEMLIGQFVKAIRDEMRKPSNATNEARRKINWNADIYLEDMSDRKIKKRINFNLFEPNKSHLLRLHDGAGEPVNIFENMWDLTPDTELLAELPAEYTFETALADLIDNSLQALWSNDLEERRLVSVQVDQQKIVIFDTGPGMDGSDGKSISKWGKMGSSDHRRSRKLAVGGKPPYLMPFFGMYGYGGPIASMHLGRRAIVSAKTKDSRKVYTLHLSRDALLNKTAPKCVWRTDGGIRDPLDDEIQISPHGSFTQVEIHDLKIKCLEIHKLQCLLKDIYFPYIQFDEELTSRKTMMPIEFQINDTDLAEFIGGEVTITNLLSCNGPEFVLQLCFMVDQDITLGSPVSKACRKGHARLKCVYFPIVGGKESIDKILEKLEEDDCAIEENFENFSRVSIRRLGRLLPDARWGMLPFMEPKQRKGDKAELFKRCCMRVKCFVETDAGFSPTPSKTDLAHHDPFTTALRGLGSRTSDKASEAVVQIVKDGKPLSILQLEKEYHDWIITMHDGYDEEIDCGEDEPVLIVGPYNKKKLGISADVLRVHRTIKRRGYLWKAGQKVKILKGAAGCSKNNLYATLEFILLEGFQGDVGGEARLICRPLGFSEDEGCSIEVNGEVARLHIHESLSFPISVIDSGKFQAIDNDTWDKQVQKRKEKIPSRIDILTPKQCSHLGIDEELPVEFPVDAGYKPPEEIVAVIRPASFNSSSSSSNLDQKYVMKGDIEMSMRITRTCGHQEDFIQAERVKPSARYGLHGLYIFSLSGSQNLFRKAGIYSFAFSAICRDSTCECEIKVTVRPDFSMAAWRFLHDDRGPLTEKSSIFARVGYRVPYLSVGMFDPYMNQLSFSSVPEATIKIETDKFVIAHMDDVKLVLSHDQLSLEIMDLLIESSDLDKIQPRHVATLKLCTRDAKFSAAVPCRVMPGTPSSVKIRYCLLPGRSFTPGYVIEDLVLEMMDAYGNHIEKDVEVSVKLDGLSFQDHGSSIRKVNQHGHVNLSGILKVEASYGSKAFLYVLVGEKTIFKKVFEVEKRELRVVSGVPDSCIAGTSLKNVIFEVFDSNGAVDVAIHGRHHTLTITSESLKLDSITIQYTFEQGRCTVPVITVPQESGLFRFLAFHTHYQDLHTNIEIFLLQAPKLEFNTVTDEETSHFQSPSSNSRMLLLQDSSSCVPSQIVLFESIIDEARVLEENIAAIALRIGEYERKLVKLNDKKLAMVREIDCLQAQIGPEYLCHVDALVNTKEKIGKEIESKGNTAAAVFCNLTKDMVIPASRKHIVQDVVGIVALLGAVSDDKLSRVLSEYLGEEYMLAIVCKSYDEAFALENYDKDGKVNRTCALHEAASTLSVMINGRFPVICLEEIRPYKGLVSNNAQRKLELIPPKLSGKVPRGFLGYAVNMINIDLLHLETRMTQGHGLRETLFYQLFGEVQVYETRADMKQAYSCIKHGAVSLDGGIMRDKGLILLGDWEPAVRFPVITSQIQRELPHYVIDIIKQIEVKKALSKSVDAQIQETLDAHSKDLNKFNKKRERLRKMFGGRSPSSYLLEYNSPTEQGNTAL